ncbi:glucose 1-dehydrogenase [Bradyrhizobium sp. BWA-3-5]|uniref:SDR family NAD(P)-dependent oxidoreductase n=1 Tax=Bradyrhizobium sp. BWA-3-5 TaxID=3080013 RepID=UPI00293E7EA5|nr:glucose 1-dehydrogenase [Bradyrhizobium sp. BWA-3-5]WOH63930.1 glucose 1-dehydrogenase [Bradyrhizobium sp. BWA-3-5]
MGRLSGKIAVITGASSGIGLRTAEIFLKEGAKVVMADIRQAEGEAAAGKLGTNAIFCQTNVAVEEQVKAMIALAVDRFGGIDCLFNNAGVQGQPGGIEEVDSERFSRSMQMLVGSVMLGMKYAAPYMKKQGSGSIINTASAAGLVTGVSPSIPYCTAKAAVIHLTRCVAVELGEVGVRVNSISPGYIATSMGWPTGVNEDAVMREVYKVEQPIPRAGLPDDIAYTAVFLASDESSFINGQDLVVDGALTAGRSWTDHQHFLARMHKAIEALKKLEVQGAEGRGIMES